MRSILFIAFILAFTVGEADARHRGHFRFGYRGHAPRGMLAPPSYALGRSANAYTRYALGRSANVYTREGREFPPPTWQLQPPDPKWQGRRYVSPGGEASVAFYASPADGEPTSAHLKQFFYRHLVNERQRPSMNGPGAFGDDFSAFLSAAKKRPLADAK